MSERNQTLFSNRESEFNNTQ